MSPFKVAASLIFVALVATGTRAETHTVHFVNNCGFGTPTLVQVSSETVLSTGADFTSNGPLLDVVAYLQTGACGFNGEGCTVIELDLMNPTSPGSGSGADISLIPPYAFSVPSKFDYFNGCEGAGSDCPDVACPDAFRSPSDGRVVTVCQADNVNIVITFCD